MCISTLLLTVQETAGIALCAPVSRERKENKDAYPVYSNSVISQVVIYLPLFPSAVLFPTLPQSQRPRFIWWHNVREQLMVCIWDYRRKERSSNFFSSWFILYITIKSPLYACKDLEISQVHSNYFLTMFYFILFCTR